MLRLTLCTSILGLALTFAGVAQVATLQSGAHSGVSSPSVAAQHERITIEGSSLPQRFRGELLVLHAKISDVLIELRCDVSQSGCVALQPTWYEIARLWPGQGFYHNCSDVQIYRMDADRSVEKPLGEYCLIEVEDASPQVQVNVMAVLNPGESGN